MHEKQICKISLHNPSIYGIMANDLFKGIDRGLWQEFIPYREK
jgi:hypothetical protein